MNALLHDTELTKFAIKYLKMTNILNQHFLFLALQQIWMVQLLKNKKKNQCSVLLNVSLLNTKSHRQNKQNVQVLIVTLRRGYATYVFVASVVMDSPDFPGPCIDSMAVE